MENWTIVEVLRHARHDWMNRLQLIKGNIALNKLETVERIMDQMILEAQQESRLSNLKLPQFAEILLTFNWEQHPFQIEYDIVDEHGSISVDDQVLSGWIKSFFSNIEEIVEPFHDNYLSISIERCEENIRFVFEFSGTIKLQEQHTLQKWLNDQKNSFKQINVNKFNLSQFSIEMIM